MKKAEVIQYCEEGAREGWFTHLMLLHIYDDEEDIPDYVVNFICYKPKPSQPFILYVGEIGLKAINDAVEQYGMHLIQEEIIEKFKPNSQ